MNQKHLWIGLAGLAVIAVIAAALTFQPKRGRLHGVVIEPSRLAPEISLTDQAGQPFNLSDTNGKIVLLFFGYTSCPDVCPTTMAALKLVRIGLEDQAKDVQVILVTTDPGNDTPQQMQTYLAVFDPTFIGLTGTRAQLEKAWKDYGVMVMDHGTTHSNRIYLIDPAGTLRLTYPDANSSDDIIADVNVILAED